MSDLTSLFTDTLAKFSFRAVLSAAATLLICLVAVHLLGKLLRRLLARTKLDERIQKYLLAGVKLILYIVTVLIVAESLNIPMTSLWRCCPWGPWASPWRRRTSWAMWPAGW